MAELGERLQQLDTSCEARVQQLRGTLDAHHYDIEGSKQRLMMMENVPTKLNELDHKVENLGKRYQQVRGIPLVSCVWGAIVCRARVFCGKCTQQ